MSANHRFIGLALALSSLALACTPERERKGDLNLTYGLTGQKRALFEVEQGRILSQWLDVATTSGSSTSCVRGTWQQAPVSLCPEVLDDSYSHFGGKLVRWRGPMGELAIEVSPAGDAVRIDGRITRGSASGNAAADAETHGSHGSGLGSQRRGGYGLSGPNNGGAARSEGPIWMHVTLPLGQGPEWDEMRKTPILYAVAAASIGLVSGEGVPPELTPSFQRKGDAADHPPMETKPD